jgi:hypothetical protein
VRPGEEVPVTEAEYVSVKVAVGADDGDAPVAEHGRRREGDDEVA